MHRKTSMILSYLLVARFSIEKEKTRKSTIPSSPKPGPLLGDRTEKYFSLRLKTQAMQVQFITKPTRKVNSKHISYYHLSA